MELGASCFSQSRKDGTGASEKKCSWQPRLSGWSDLRLLAIQNTRSRNSAVHAEEAVRNPHPLRASYTWRLAPKGYSRERGKEWVYVEKPGRQTSLNQVPQANTAALSREGCCERALRLCGLLAENSRAQSSHETNVRRTQTGSFSTGHLAGQTGKVMKKKDSKAVTDPRRLRRHSGEMRRDSPDRILGQKADTNGRLVKSKQRLEFSSCLFMLVF